MHLKWTKLYAPAQTTCIFHFSPLFCSLPSSSFHCLLSFKPVNPEYAGKHTVKHSECCLCDNLEAHFSKQYPRVWVSYIVYYQYPAKKGMCLQNCFFEGLRKKLVEFYIKLCACYEIMWLHDSQFQSAQIHFLSVGCKKQRTYLRAAGGDFKHSDSSLCVTIDLL